MSNMFTSYDYVILDTSCLFAEIRDSLFNDLLSAKNVVAAPTFTTCLQLLKCVPYNYQVRFAKRFDHQFNSNLFRIVHDYGIVDTIGLAKMYMALGKKIVIVECSSVLEDSMRDYNGDKIWLYSLFENRIIEAQEDKVLAKTSKQGEKLEFYKVSEGDVIYDDKSQAIELSTVRDGGAEANIFQIKGRTDILAKIFNEDEDVDNKSVLTKGKLDNIEMLREVYQTWELEWSAMPISILYKIKACQMPIGYTMKNFANADFLNKNMLIAGDIKNALLENENAKVKDILNICLMLARQVEFLAMNDIYISDYNTKNFAQSRLYPDVLLMVDTDSFCQEDYSAVNKTYKGSLSKEYDMMRKKDLIYFYQESLIAFVLGLLVREPDRAPMQVTDGKKEFLYSDDRIARMNEKKMIHWGVRWNSIPPNLRELFKGVFEEGKYPSIQILMYELVQALKSPFADKTYYDLYAEILGIERNNNEAVSTPHSPKIPEFLQGHMVSPENNNVKKTKSRKTIFMLIFALGVVLWVVGLLVR